METGVDAGAGGIGQSFLDSNKFSVTDPVLGQGVLALALVTSSSGRGVESSSEERSWGLSVVEGV